jgi:hypothetical protein
MPVAPAGDRVNPSRPPGPLAERAASVGESPMTLLQRLLVALANLVFALVFGRALGAP